LVTNADSAMTTTGTRALRAAPASGGSAMTTAGTVVEFDEHRGLGTVEAEDGRRLAFHCTSLADGSRAIDPGTVVVFTVVAGHHGRWEAADVSREGERPGQGEGRDQ